ncbi:UDP-N-acetylmuramoyl-tripeptide--D-alanyl-D-alanine ligase [Aureimonas mangrovi]|uniref:UDP-N-acetylmuramoyl-tripeptide--D-alanyl-D- alanine ligase n=1 Tax=Aureimonas mangrovi TaxID=2758041 RepID=UPI001FE2FE3B|nr:Mur ligase family protein [Aureimonas mangrovi]
MLHIVPQGRIGAERLEAIHAALRSQDRLAAPFPAVVLFFSVSDADRRAEVFSVSATSFETAWTKGVDRLRWTLEAKGMSGRWLRVEAVDTVRAADLATVRELLSRTKRNYFRWGLSLDPRFEVAFTEQELNANAMLYGGNRIEHAVLNENNCRVYSLRRFGPQQGLDLGDERPAWLFATRGVFSGEDGHVHPLAPPGPDGGRRAVKALDEPTLMSLVEKGSAYLAGQVQRDGRFIYGWHPCFDRQIATYNTLRHASTTYAMTEAWEVTRDPALGQAIERALEHLTGALIEHRTLQDGEDASFLVDVGGEIKLGGSAVAILALAKHARVTGDESRLPLMRRLARGILHMQDCETGAFRHVLRSADLTTKQAFRTIYYEGEAAFALMRLYEIDRDPEWLAAVERAFDHFIASEHWGHHDHWLGYCVNELTRHRRDERYFRFALRNVSGYLDFVENRITTFPTLLELMMAAQETVSRIVDDPDLAHLLDEIDLPRFERALEKRARYLLNGHFWPEMAMYFRNPQRIAGAFFIRHHAFRVRIDDVEHYLSGLIAYRRYRPYRARFRAEIARRTGGASGSSPQKGWTAEMIETVTSGRWLERPPQGWKAAGLSTHAAAFCTGDLVALRASEGTVGLRPDLLGRLEGWSGVLTSEPETLRADIGPVLHVADAGAAVLAMGCFARRQMTGRVVGVTGSAGKTTVVAMMGEALSAFGPVAATRANANLPHGVAWNLASMDWTAPHAVLEMAIGRMGTTSRMAKPDLAIFTNVHPAHLREGTTLADIARTKAAIFSGMKAGGIAVLNHDMEELEIVRCAALARGLHVVSYGEGARCDAQLLAYDQGESRVEARVGGRAVSFRLGAAGRHMALNSLAVLAAVSALGLPLGPAIERLAAFAALPGRGETFELSIDGRRVTIIDEAYNANPGSMKAAIERLSGQGSRGRRIAVLAPMAELGPDEKLYHTQLAPLFAASAIDRVHACGDLFGGFWDALPADRRGTHAQTLGALQAAVLRDLREGDTILFKASNSSGLHRTVALLRRRADADA